MARTALLNVMVQAATKAGRSLARDFGEIENLQVSRKAQVTLSPRQITEQKKSFVRNFRKHAQPTAC